MRSAARVMVTRYMSGCRITKHVVGKYVRCELERRAALNAARQAEPLSASYEGIHKERGEAGEAACAGVCAYAELNNTT